MFLEKYFTPVIYFLVMSLADFFGRNLAGIIQRVSSDISHISDITIFCESPFV